MEEGMELPSNLVPGKGGRDAPLVGAPLPDRTMESSSGLTDSQALKNVNFRHDDDIAEVREFSTISKESPPPARCCLMEFFHQLCGALRDSPQSSDKDEAKAEGGKEEAQDEAFDKDTIGWKHSRTAYDGYLWKLNANNNTEDEMADILSWRRRQFYLQRNQDKLALMYTSEKENGQVQVSCLLSSVTTSATIETLKPCTVTPTTEEQKKRVVSDLETYDTAFGQKRFDYDYSRDLPTEFNPFLIVSTNEDGTSEQIVLSGGNARMSSRWEQAIGRALQQVKRQQKRAPGQPNHPPAASR